MIAIRGFLVFIVVALLHLVSLSVGWNDVATVTKFALMPALIFGFTAATDRPYARADLVFMAALVLAWLGDIFVTDASGATFIVGLACFLGAHVVYLFLFIRVVRVRRVPWAAVVIVAWWAGLLYLLRDDLGVLFIPLAVYGAVLGASTAAACATTPMIAGGAVLFLASDTALAWALFAPSPLWWQSDVVIMSLYVTGQYLIAFGFLAARKAKRKAASVTG